MQAQTHNTTGADEIHALTQLAAAIEEMLPDGAGSLLSWREKAAALSDHIDFNTPVGERALDDLALALRADWLSIAHQVSSGYLMSPLHEQPKAMPSGKKFQFDYERSSRPESLELRGFRAMPPPEGWHGCCKLFSSGMSAIATLVQVCCARLKGPTPDHPVQLDMFGGYFETWRLLDTVHDAVMKVEYLTSTEQLEQRVTDGKTDVLVIEPVAYDWDMTVFDLDGFAKAWRQAGENRPRLVIVDTSLTADTFTMDHLLSAFGDDLPWMVAFIRSGLKLDQQGLELSNVGIVNVFVPKGDASPIYFERLNERLNVNRAITGGALTVNQTAVLEAPWFLDLALFAAHAGRVFENNKKLAGAIELTGGVFSRINHPALADQAMLDWAESPFVVAHVAGDSVGRLGKLVAIIVHEARERGLCFDLASSFGFRGHRFEVIRPLVQIRELDSRAGVLKIAMGSRSGPSIDGIITLINEIGAFDDWDALAAAYPDVPAYAKGSFGVYVARPPKPGPRKS
ncbi:MAG: hypothetical protein HOH04_00595 [Rhodospirillaceae bacterium]|nr:hypothetical protein [Rhodospirillaceae bacterium]